MEDGKHRLFKLPPESADRRTFTAEDSFCISSHLSSLLRGASTPVEACRWRFCI